VMASGYDTGGTDLTVDYNGDGLVGDADGVPEFVSPYSSVLADDYDYMSHKLPPASDLAVEFVEWCDSPPESDPEVAEWAQPSGDGWVTPATAVGWVEYGKQPALDDCTEVMFEAKWPLHYLDASPVCVWNSLKEKVRIKAKARVNYKAIPWTLVRATGPFQCANKLNPLVDGAPVGRVNDVGYRALDGDVYVAEHCANVMPEGPYYGMPLWVLPSVMVGCDTLAEQIEAEVACGDGPARHDYGEDHGHEYWTFQTVVLFGSQDLILEGVIPPPAEAEPGNEGLYYAGVCLHPLDDG